MILTTILSLAILGQQIILPGDDLKVGQAAEKSQIIAVGKITEMGDIIGAGTVSFGTLTFEHSEVLKGTIPEKELKRLTFGAKGYETCPQKDEEYLVFVEQSMDHVTIVKMLTKTTENVEATKAEIKKKKS